MILPIIVFGDSAGRYISTIESQRGHMSVVRQTGDISELLGFAQAGIARVVLLVGNREDVTRSVIAQLQAQGLAVVMVTDPHERPDINQLHWVSTLASGSEVLQMLNTATAGEDPTGCERQNRHPQNSPTVKDGEPSPAANETGRGRLISLWSGHGSPGRTTLAINLASYAARRGYRVCLIDADTYAPSVGSLVGIVENYSGLAQLCYCADRGRLHRGSLKSAMSTVSVGSAQLDVLTGITRPERWPEIQTQTYTPVIEYLRHSYDLVIADTAPALEEDEELSFDGLAPCRNAATRITLEAADLVLLLGSADVLGIPRLFQAYEALDTFYGEKNIAPPRSVWINKVRQYAAGANPRENITQAWHRFGPDRNLAGFLPYDRVTLDRAWLGGQTLAEYAPATELALAVNGMLTSSLSLLEAPMTARAVGGRTAWQTFAGRLSPAASHPRIRRLGSLRQKNRRR